MKSKNTNKENLNDDVKTTCRHINDREVFISINNSSDSKELDQLIRIAFDSQDEFKEAITTLKTSIKKSQDYDADIVSYHIKAKYDNKSNNQLFLNALKESTSVIILNSEDEINIETEDDNLSVMRDDTKLSLSQLITSKSFVFDTIQLYVKVNLNFEGLTSYILLYTYENRSNNKIISNQKSKKENIDSIKIHEIAKEAIHNHLITCTEAIETIKQNRLNSTLKSEKEAKL